MEMEMEETASGTRTPLRHSSSVKRRSSTRRTRKNRRLSTPETSSSGIGVLGCCFSAQDSPEREFWSDVVFVTPQGTPKLSIRDASRHSTLNFNMVVSTANDRRPSNVVSTSQSRDGTVPNVQVVQAEIPPFRPATSVQCQSQNAVSTQVQSSSARTTTTVATTPTIAAVQPTAQTVPVSTQSSGHVALSDPAVTLATTHADSPPTVTIPPFCDQPRTAADVTAQQTPASSAQQVPITSARQQVRRESASLMQCTCGGIIIPEEMSLLPIPEQITTSESNMLPSSEDTIDTLTPTVTQSVSVLTSDVSVATSSPSLSTDTLTTTANDMSEEINMAPTTGSLSSVSNDVMSAANTSPPVLTSSLPTTANTQVVATDSPPTATNFSSAEADISTDIASKPAECASSQTQDDGENRAKSQLTDASCQENELAKTTTNECQRQSEQSTNSDAMKKSTETQTDIKELVAPVKTASEDVVVSRKNTAIQTHSQAVTTTTMPITVPTALGQIVLHSPPIMSTRVAGPIVSSQVSTGFSYRPLDNNLAVSRYASFTCSSVNPSTVKLKPTQVKSSQSSGYCQIPSSIGNTSNTTHVYTSTPQPVMPIYAKVSKKTKKPATQNKQPVERNTPPPIIPMSCPISTSSEDKDSKAPSKMPSEPKKKYRRPAPGIPNAPYVNMLPVNAKANIPCTCNHGSMMEVPKPVVDPTPPEVSPEKAKAKLMQEVMENKPQVQNLVLVKRSQSQEQANTPKLLRRSQVSQTLRRPGSVIKGPERQRLAKSVESLEDVVLDLDIAYEFVRRQNYRTSFIGDVSPCQAEKQMIYEDNSFGDVQTIMKHTKKEPIYALPQPACFGEDTIQAVKRITDKYNTPQRWKMQAKSFESSLQRPTTVTMAGKDNTTSQQPHMVMATPPSISAPYTREKARLGLFYRSYAAEICICDCLAELRQRSGPNEPWLPTHTGRPILVFNTGEGRRRRQLELVIADSNTALPLWSDFITYLSEFRPVDPTNMPRPIHQLRLSSNLRTQVLIEYYNTKAAEDFYNRFLAITSDPSDTLWMVSGDRSSLKKRTGTRKKKLSNKSLISQPLHFAHVTHMEAVCIREEVDAPFATSRMRSRSFEDLN